MSAHVRSYSTGRLAWRNRALATAVLMAASSTGAPAQTSTFARDDYASFAGARSILSADFNRDGWPDVAQANGGRNSVTILLDHPHDGLARAADVPVGATPFDLTTADFNRDGIPDLAMANADGDSISVLLGKGDASFTRSDIAAPGTSPRGIAAADVNHDGKPDLIYSGYLTRTVQVLIGDGVGGFTKGVAYLSPALQPQGLAAADFNHDGHLDVAVAYASATGLRILYGNGGTAFTARTVAGATSLNVVAVGDFNRDGWEDVAAASTAGSTVSIYHGSAAGLVHKQTCLVGSSPRGIDVGDLNGDGLLDVVTANRASSTVSVLLGDVAHPGAFLAHTDAGAGSGSRAVVLADFDADGRLDVATGNEYAASATVLSNRTFLAPAGFAFRRTTIVGASNLDPYFAKAWPGDFNRDGRTDIATLGADGQIAVFLTGGPSISLPGTPLTVADIDGDGNPDVLYDASSGVIGTYLGDGRGGFTASPTTAWVGLSAFAIGDINRDGKPDLVSVGSDAPGSYALQIGLGRGNGTFAVPIARVSLFEYATAVALADVNRDGRPDVVVLLSGYSRGVPNEARVWFGTGTGGLTASSWGTSFASRFGVQFNLADINHDGFVDIVGSDYQQMAVALGSASGFPAPVYTTVTNEDWFPGAVSIGDLNGDGHPDVAFESGTIMFGNGDGSFVSGGRFDAAATSIAEVTRDGLPDIVASPSERGVFVLANTRDAFNQPPTVEAGPDWTIAFGATQGEDCSFWVTPAATDPDAHGLTYEWRWDGAVISTFPVMFLCGPPPGTYTYSVTVRDGRGGAATDGFKVTIQPIKEIVLWASDASVEGAWTLVDDQTAAGGVRAYDPNSGAPKVTTPLAFTPNSMTFRFYADPNETYKLWIRMKGDGNSWANDSVWVQFRGATDAAGVEKYQMGTSNGLSVSLEECSGCGISGWGWEDDGWGALNRNGGLLRFPQDVDRDPKYLTIQTREDGVSIDQVVLSAETYLTARPGAAKKDTTILPKTSFR